MLYTESASGLEPVLTSRLPLLWRFPEKRKAWAPLSVRLSVGRPANVTPTGSRFKPEAYDAPAVAGPLFILGNWKWARLSLLERRAAEASEVLQAVGWADGQGEAHTRGGTPARSSGVFFGCPTDLRKRVMTDVNGGRPRGTRECGVRKGLRDIHGITQWSDWTRFCNSNR